MSQAFNTSHKFIKTHGYTINIGKIAYYHAQTRQGHRGTEIVFLHGESLFIPHKPDEIEALIDAQLPPKSERAAASSANIPHRFKHKPVMAIRKDNWEPSIRKYAESNFGFIESTIGE